MLFPLGQVVATPGALEALEVAGVEPADYLDRHVVGDDGVKLWIITEADRSATTLLLPSEY